MLKALVEKLDDINEQMENFGREMDMRVRSQMEIPEIKV